MYLARAWHVPGTCQARTRHVPGTYLARAARRSLRNGTCQPSTPTRKILHTRTCGHSCCSATQRRRFCLTDTVATSEPSIAVLPPAFPAGDPPSTAPRAASGRALSLLLLRSPTDTSPSPDAPRGRGRSRLACTGRASRGRSPPSARRQVPSPIDSAATMPVDARGRPQAPRAQQRARE